MYEVKYEEYNDRMLKIINTGENPESLGLFSYVILDNNYPLWSGHLHNPDAKIEHLSSLDKLIIKLNILFKNKAKISPSYTNYIKVMSNNPEDFIDWFLYIDDFNFKNKIKFESITILNNKKENDSVYNATIIRKNPSGNVINFNSKNAINILKQSLGKNNIEILTTFNDKNTSKLFLIKIDYNCSISMPLKYLEESYLPGALPDDIKTQISKLKTKKS